MKSFRSTLIFAAVVAAVVGYAVFEMKRGEEIEVGEAKQDRLFAWDEKDVREIEVTRNEDSFKIVREGDNWKLTKPVEDRVDDFKVTSYLSSLLTQTAKVVEEKNDQWSDYGLENSTITMAMVGADGTRRSIEVSQDKAYDGSYFIRDGDRLMVGSSDWTQLVKKKANEVREKRFFHHSAQIVGFRIRVPGEKIDLHIEKQDNKWMFPKDPAIAISRKEVDKFVMDSSTFKALDFVAEETEPKLLAHFGLNKPELIIEYWLEGQEGAGPHWWMKAAKAKKGNEGFAYHIDRQTIYKVSEDVVRRYSRTLNDFRDKKLPFEFKQDAIHELSMKTRLTNLTLVKKGGKWTASDPVQGKEVDQATVKSLLAKLGEMEAKFYLGTKSSRGMKPPVNSVVLKNHKGDEVLALSWGTSFKAKQEVKTDSEEQLYYVKTNKVADTLGVPTSVIDALPGQTLLKSVTAKPLEPKGSSQPAPQSAPASTPAKGS